MALISALGILCTIGIADAGNVKLNWDPAFDITGTLFPGLGFSGTGILNVPDQCVTSEGVVTRTECEADAPSDSIFFTSLFLNLYNTSNPSTILETLDFLPATSPSTVDQIVVGLDSATFQPRVIGVDTGIFGPISSGFLDENVWLQFVSNPSSAGGGCEFFCQSANPQAFMFVAGGDNSDCPGIDGNVSCIKSDPAQVHFDPIPEPGSIALLLAAMGASGLIGRRRRKLAPEKHRSL
jgi:hypothetical protein